MNGTFPGFDWPAWARPQGIDRIAGVVVMQPAFFRSVRGARARAAAGSTWRAWLAARYITALSPYVNQDISDARFDFFGTLSHRPARRDSALEARRVAGEYHAR